MVVVVTEVGVDRKNYNTKSRICSLAFAKSYLSKVSKLKLGPFSRGSSRPFPDAPEFESAPYQKFLFNVDLRDLLRAIESAMSNYPIGGVIPFSSDGPEPPVDAGDTAETPPNEPPLENTQSLFNERIKLLGESTGYKLREGQVLALRELYNKKDIILVTTMGFGKTLIIIKFNSLFNIEDRSIIVIISPLKMIE